ncbi:gamma-glutamylcyclotransferase [Streptomyces sp. tea 10]|nr:gamma-glutamylcyclotransferase [Streptomyces sp. tea 10]
MQESLFNTPVPQAPAVLLGHGLIDVEITDPAVVRLSGLSVHRGLVRRVEGSVDGTVLTLTAQQLAAADAYEVDAYTRRRVLVSEPHTGAGQARRGVWPTWPPILWMLRSGSRWWVIPLPSVSMILPVGGQESWPVTTAVPAGGASGTSQCPGSLSMN